MSIHNCKLCLPSTARKALISITGKDLYEIENLLKSAKKIVQTIIESGKCSTCRERKYAMEIPKQKVIIGENIRIMVVYMVIMQGLSYREAKDSLSHQYGIELSSGEIANILEGEANRLQRGRFVRAEGDDQHLDEPGL